MLKIKHWVVEEKKHVRFYHDWNDKEVKCLHIVSVFLTPVNGNYPHIAQFCVSLKTYSLEALLYLFKQTFEVDYKLPHKLCQNPFMAVNSDH